MTFSISIQARKSAVLTGSDCLVIGIFEDQPLSRVANEVDAATNGLLKRLIKAGDVVGKNGSTTMIHEVKGIGSSRLLLVGMGKPENLDQKQYTASTRAAWRALLATKVRKVAFALSLLPVQDREADWSVHTAILELRREAYRFVQMKSEAGAEPHELRTVIFNVEQQAEQAAKSSVRVASALANGMDLCRDLGNLPGSVCTPRYLAETAKQLARDWNLKVEVLNERQIEALKMGSFLSVARASKEPPHFIVLQYQGAARNAAPIVLVGKGITFDTGGISLKPPEAMDEMKYDMCGAASVLGTMRAIAEIGLKLNVVALIPTCENMPGGDATKPGDIVTSMNGLTIEVLNTDAEGRLILCDALTYAERFTPAAVIDVATLTGACVVALGHHNSGLFSQDDTLAAELLDASKEASDPAWRMPLDDEYQEQLKSNFADMANVGGRPGGSVTAACFLSRFTEAYPWAHLDIAGTAWKGGTAKGATGRPVPLLTKFLINRVPI